MGNRERLTNPCAEIALDVETTPIPIIGVTFPYFSVSTTTWSWRLRRLYNGLGAPAAMFMYAVENFGCITAAQCDEGLNHYSNKIYLRHMKRQRIAKGKTKKKWKRTRSNHIGKP